MYKEITIDDIDYMKSLLTITDEVCIDELDAIPGFVKSEFVSNLNKYRNGYPVARLETNWADEMDITAQRTLKNKTAVKILILQYFSWTGEKHEISIGNNEDLELQIGDIELHYLDKTTLELKNLLNVDPNRVIRRLIDTESNYFKQMFKIDVNELVNYIFR